MIIWYRLTTVTFLLIVTRTVQSNQLIDFGEDASNVLPTFDDDSDQFLTALTRDEEQEAHSAFIDGLQYVSGGAGEGKQHLSPTGEFENQLEVKTDEDMPSYCDPPNPCPLGFEDEDCDTSAMSKFSAEFSRAYQNQQYCLCDKDHDQCSFNNILFKNSGIDIPKDILKRSRRVRRETRRQSKEKNETKSNAQKNVYRHGQTLKFHVAKKSPSLAS